MQQIRTPRDIRVAKTYLQYVMGSLYHEKPVDIKQFIVDPKYMGNATQRGSKVYPCWHDALDKMFSDDSKYLVVLTGAIGGGKTTCATIAMAYCMYRMLCLHSLKGFYGKMDIGRVAVSFFNLTRTLGGSKGFNTLMGYLNSSPWFQDRAKKFGTVGKKDRLEYL